MSDYPLTSELAAEQDYLRALRPLEQLGLPHDDPVYRAAALIVRRCRTASSAMGYGYIVARTLRWMARNAIDPRTIDRLDFMVCWNTLGGLSPATRRQRQIILHALFQEFIRRGIASDDPTAAIIKESESESDDEADEATPWLSESQVNDLIASISPDLNHPDYGLEAHRDLAMLAIMVRLCLRRAEVRRLRWAMFRPEDGGYVLRYVAKGGKAKTRHVPVDVWARLEDWRCAYQRATGLVLRASDPVFLSLGPQALKALDEGRFEDALRPMALTAIERVVKQRLDAIGIAGYRYSPHCLRTTGANLALDAGADLVEVQYLLGHKSIVTTRRHYVRRKNKSGRPAIERMPVRFEIPASQGSSL